MKQHCSIGVPLALWTIIKILCIIFLYVGAWRVGVFDGTLRPLDNVDSLPPIGLRPFIYWDSNWYIGIAEKGYAYDPGSHVQQNVGFFPLYPLLISLGMQLGMSSYVAAVLVPNLASCAAAVIFYRWMFESYGSKAAFWGLLLWLSYPAQMFHTVAYSEGIMGLCFVLLLKNYSQRASFRAGFWGALASALRPQGFLLAMPLFLRAVWERRWRDVFASAFACVGLLAFMSYLEFSCGEPILFIKIQQYWRAIDVISWNPIDWIAMLVVGLQKMLTLPLNEGFKALHTGKYYDPLMLLWTLIWIPFVWKKFDGYLALTLLAMVVVVWHTGIATLGRHTSILLPVFAVAGSSLAEKRIRWVVLAVSLLILMGYCYGFGSGSAFI